MAAMFFFPLLLQVIATDRGTPQEMAGTAVVSQHNAVVDVM